MGRKRKKSIKLDTITEEEIQSALEESKNCLSSKSHRTFEKMAEAFQAITLILEAQNVRIEKLEKELKGIKSEKSSKVFEQVESKGNAVTCSSKKKVKKRKGHGRLSVEKYTGAEKKWIENSELNSGMKILETMKEIKQEVKQANGKKTRTGIFTTGIVSNIKDKKVALFFTGRKHAGENFDELLKQRESDRSPPLQICDGKSGNTLQSTSATISNCNAHARRYFVDVSDNFPEAGKYVLLEVYRNIYKFDAEAKISSMSAQERLEHHQEKSVPIMEEFRLWLKRQFDEKLVEENSGLGKAINYVQKRWSELTRFLHVPGAPLDNNICERALKKAICHRKNSLFYKTANGASVGDLFMSIIHTCFYAGANPFEYITQLQKNLSRAIKDPASWLPWNYSLQLNYNF